jgi:ATP-dependent RNA helicase DeaD
LPTWRREQPPEPARLSDSEPGFTRFRINWGSRAGADPRRILGHVCRRGDIDSRMVGAIKLDANWSTFDVDNSVAMVFTRRVQRRDARDPHLFIVRDDGRGARAPRQQDA